ncbi:SLAM family member 9-like isoform X2 [Salarias fasciatus]|uniref:SLAM family member 5-like n=1 Tax=Salarias fasciatus TaxID=181472 RepID=A0A672II63_SALFA|nr:SLAM family member 9-like isoform X2 [Salarias fasciatus]
MAAGRLPRLTCFFTFSVLGLLGVCIPHDVEASNEGSVIHKNVGETVELKSDLLSTEGVTVAEWRYGGIRLTSTGTAKENPQFKGRIQINPQNFSLTVRNLTPQDSGDYSFVSEVNYLQRPTVTFTLRVHEPIKKPLLSIINVTRDALNRSCTVFLECSTSVHDVSYSWTVGSQKKSGSKLQHVIRPQDGEITFTCTISDQITEVSSSINQTCSNDTSTDKPANINTLTSSDGFVLIVAGGVSLLTVIVVGTVVAVCRSRRKWTGRSTYDQTVYDEIADVPAQNRSSVPCSVYETIETVNTVSPVTPGVQTVYDKIQLHRVT